MKNITELIAFIILASACNNENENRKPSFESFIFSHSEECCNYSMKFTDNDTMFIQRRFPPPRQNYYSIISSKDKLKFDSFLNVIDFINFDTVYLQKQLQDGSSYKFYIIKNQIIKWTYIYGDDGPAELYEFGNWLKDLKDRQNLSPIETIINFENLNYILLPEVSPPPTKENSH